MPQRKDRSGVYSWVAYARCVRCVGWKLGFSLFIDFVAPRSIDLNGLDLSVKCVRTDGRTYVVMTSV